MVCVSRGDQLPLWVAEPSAKFVRRPTAPSLKKPAATQSASTRVQVQDRELNRAHFRRMKAAGLPDSGPFYTPRQSATIRLRAEKSAIQSQKSATQGELKRPSEEAVWRPSARQCFSPSAKRSFKSQSGWDFFARSSSVRAVLRLGLLYASDVCADAKVLNHGRRRRNCVQHWPPAMPAAGSQTARRWCGKALTGQVARCSQHRQAQPD